MITDTNYSYSDTKPNLDELDFPNPVLHKLRHFNINDMYNILFYGHKSSGKKTCLYAFLATILDKRIYDVKNLVFEHDKKTYYYKTSIYHLEFNPLEFNFNDKNFINFFLKTYIESPNVLFQIPKIVVIKNADHLSQLSQMALRRIIEKNNITARFIIELNHLSSFPEPLLSRFLKVRVSCPSADAIKQSLYKMMQNDRITDSDKGGGREVFIDKIIEAGCFYEDIPLYNLKKIYGLYNYYKFTKKIYVNVNDEKVLELIQIIHSKKLLMGNLEKIKDLIHQLFINLYPMKQLINDIYNFIVQKHSFSILDELFQKITDLTIECDVNINKGNKEAIHVEYYLVALYEILLQHHSSNLFHSSNSLLHSTSSDNL